ncbi:MAG: cation:proton antiporter [Candidatus Omnitrophica bacterium]|nr:cation:proton antiporter [Candidatus Omnitrophota bacterium]
MININPFFELGLILAVATIMGALGRKLRQPLIIMFLITGILSGPSGLAIITNYGKIELFAQMGIALLLFIVGLRLDINLIRKVGFVALATGLGQIIFTSGIGFLIALSLGITPLAAAYVSVALAFSSTIIIVKLLSDKKEIDSLHGQISVGFLIVQDIVAILALVGLTTFGSVLTNNSVFAMSLIMLAKGLGFLAVIFILTRYILPGLLKRLAESQELLLLFAISWAVILAAGGDFLGFNKEIGAFLAGISLASTRYRDLIGSKLATLRDFLLLFFFIGLGARLEWSIVGTQTGTSLILSLFVLIGNPIIVLIIMGFMGYRRRTGFMAGLTVAQISEFSLIVAALGLSIGHIRPETMGLITMVGVITIFASTYMILYSESIYRIFEKPLKIFEKRNPYRETTLDAAQKIPEINIILLGLGEYGSAIASYLLNRKKNIVAVDFDPEVLKRWQDRGTPVLYGDAADPEIMEQLPLHKARWVISTIRSKNLNLALLNMLKIRGYKGKTALTAINAGETKIYKEAGAQIVLQPFIDAVEQAADALTDAMDMLPDNSDWPIAFREIRIKSGSVFTGKSIKDIPLRPVKGISILAVSRAGKVIYDLAPEFRIYPGDRLVIMGPAAELKQAELFMNETREDDAGETERFMLGEIRIAENSDKIGRTLAELKFHQQYDVTVVGINRQGQRIIFPGPDMRLKGEDRLAVIGISKSVENLKQLDYL